MYDSKGFLKVTGQGSIVRKFITEKDDRCFGEVTIVTERKHKEKEYKSYTRLKVQGGIAKTLLNRLNEGDQIVISGDLVNHGQVMAQNVDANGDATGNAYKAPIVCVDVQTMQEGKLTRKTQEQRAANRQSYEQGQQEAPQQAPSQPMAQEPQQAPMMNNEPPVDFDDDIPF